MVVTNDDDSDIIKFDSPVETNKLKLEFKEANKNFYSISEWEIFGK